MLFLWLRLSRPPSIPLCYRKSTFFNVLTSSEVPAENFPFCTKGELQN